MAATTPRSLPAGEASSHYLNFRLLRPSILIDINRIEASAFISETATDIRVGALTRHYQLETSPVIARHLPVSLLRDDARGASGDPQPRHHRRQPGAWRSRRRTTDDGAAPGRRASHRVGLRRTHHGGARLFPRRSHRRPQRRRDCHRDRAAETAAADRLGFCRGLAPPRRFRARRRRGHAGRGRGRDRRSPHRLAAASAGAMCVPPCRSPLVSVMRLEPPPRRARQSRPYAAPSSRTHLHASLDYWCHPRRRADRRRSPLLRTRQRKAAPAIRAHHCYRQRRGSSLAAAAAIAAADFLRHTLGLNRTDVGREHAPPAPVPCFSMGDSVRLSPDVAVQVVAAASNGLKASATSSR